MNDRNIREILTTEIQIIKCWGGRVDIILC